MENISRYSLPWLINQTDSNSGFDFDCIKLQIQLTSHSVCKFEVQLDILYFVSGVIAYERHWCCSL